MNRILSLAGLLALAWITASPSAPEAGPVKQYAVQLIWGTNHEPPKGNRFKAVPAGELRDALSSVVKWKDYWEVNAQKATVKLKEPAKLRLSSECQVEIEFVSPTIREVRLIGKGKLVRKTRRELDNPELTILGGDIETGGGWFVAIRQDEPKTK